MDRYSISLLLVLFCLLPAFSQDEGITVKSNRVGIMNDNPSTTVEISAVNDPTLRLSQGKDQVSFFELIDGNATIAHIRKKSGTGNSLIDLDPFPLDGSSESAVRLFRSINSTGRASLQIMTGDNTPNPNHLLAGNSSSYVCKTIGDFGIGTSVPNEKLDVYGNIAISNGKYLLGRGASDGYKYQLIGLDGNDDIIINRSALLYGRPSGVAIGVGANARFDIRNSSNVSLLRIDEDNGFVGLGTLTPASKLDVSGNVSVRGNKLQVGEDVGAGFASVEVGSGRTAAGHSYVDLTSDVNYPDYGFRIIRSVDNQSSLVHRGSEVMNVNLPENAPVQFIFSGVPRMTISDQGIIPVHDDFLSLGSSAKRWNSLWSVNGVSQSSDRRLKKDIGEIKYGLSELMNLSPVSYKWKNGDQGEKLGFIAQDVMDIVPEVVNGSGSEDYLSINYSELIPVLVRAIQEQQIQIEKLTKIVSDLTHVDHDVYSAKSK